MLPSCTGESAAQNGLVLQICPQCGAVNTERAEVCSFCEASLAQDEELPEAVAAPSSQPPWRLEVARKLEAYRARRGRPRPDKSQVALPFLAGTEQAPQGRQSGGGSAVARLRQPDHVEIAALQPKFDFAAAHDQRPRPDNALLPVAELPPRVRAGLCDLSVLVLSYLGFLGLFSLLGGHFSFDRLDAAVYAATVVLFYSVYVVLFTVFGRATPGMEVCGLRVVSFEGNRPSLRQLLWRSFGYLIAAGAGLLGFLWSLWDEDHLTWHDRISQTYITPVSKSPRAAFAERTSEE